MSIDRHVLNMDELIIYDGIHNIVAAQSPLEFLKGLIGPDLRYGRATYYMAAPFAYVGNHFWGAQGLIVGYRIWYSLCIVLACFLFLYLWIPDWELRFLGVLTLVTLPSAIFYFEVPKPEPMLVLSILSVIYFLSKNWRAVWGWFALGMAIGLKISALPFAFILVAVATFLSWRGHKKIMLKQIFFLFLGWFINIPTVLLDGFTEYFNWTFKNATHGTDDATVRFGDWISLLNDTYFASHLIFILIVTFSLVIAALYFWPRLKKLHDLEKNFFTKEVLLFLAFGTFTFPIMLKVKRLWFFYLHAGITAFVLCILILIAHALRNKNIRIKLAGVGLAISLLLNGCYMYPRAKFQLVELSRRTRQEWFKQAEGRYQFVLNELSKFKRNRPLEIAYDPVLFLPQNSENFNFSCFLAAFNAWENKYDFIVNLNSAMQEPAGFTPKSSSVDYDAAIEGKKRYLEHVSAHGACRVQPCYRLEKEYLGVRIYKRNDFL